jgi:hypothetical protein
MNNLRILAFCVAVAALAGCDNSDHTIVGGPGADEQTNTAGAPVHLPPMIQASMSYRCKDNSTVFIDWFNDNKTANVKPTRDGAPTTLTVAEPGKPYTFDGYILFGSPGAKEVKLTRPGKGDQTCHA